jgi:hypothetical protein
MPATELLGTASSNDLLTEMLIVQVAKQLTRMEASKQILAAGQQANDSAPAAQGRGAVGGKRR